MTGKTADTAKPKKAKKGTRKPRTAKIDWVEAKEWWAFSNTRTHQDVADKYGVALQTVKKHSSSPYERWGDLRRWYLETQLSEIATDGLKRAFEKRADAVEELIRVEYKESLDQAEQLRKMRVSRGSSWTTNQHKAYAGTMCTLFDRMRLALAMATEIVSTPEEAKKELESIDWSKVSTDDLKRLRDISVKMEPPKPPEAPPDSEPATEEEPAPPAEAVTDTPPNGDA